MRLTRYLVIGLCVLLTSCFHDLQYYFPDQTVYSRMSITQAREVVRKHGSVRWAGAAVNCSLTNEKDKSSSWRVVSFRGFTSISASWFEGPSSVGQVTASRGNDSFASFWVQTGAETKSLADALYVLSHTPESQLRIPDDPAEQARFDETVRQYRAQLVKPVLPEEAWKYKVQADAATKEKLYDEAIDLYGNALNVAPWWPEGHFNRALLMGNVQDYYGAVQEMKRYLVLAPESPDARKAQDQVYQWERQIQ